jgi:hypothetical protein
MYEVESALTEGLARHFNQRSRPGRLVIAQMMETSQIGETSMRGRHE